MAANQANSQHSTGPKTPEGNTKSRFNAVKYGLTSNSALWQHYQNMRTCMCISRLWIQ